MKAKVFILVSLFALLMTGCSTTNKQAALPEDKQAANEAQAKAKPTRTEIEVKVAQELKRLGESKLTEEQRRALADPKEKVTYDIPITINAQVERWIDYFQTRIPKRFQIWLTRSGRYDKMMRGILRSYGLPEDLFYLAMIESGFSCNAYSRAHAVGPWQFIRGTGRRYKLKIDYWVDERRDPVKSTHAAAQYLRDLYKEFGSWYLAAAGYNAGEGKIRRALKRYKADDFWDISHHRRRYLKRETKNYVPKMIAAALIAKEPEKYGFKQIKYGEPMTFDIVKVHGGTSLGVAAKIAGIKTQQLAALNPELRRWCTPPNRSKYSLRIPKGTKASFETAYAALPVQKRKARVGTIKVRVQKGDTLGRIAATYRVSLRDLISINPRVNPRRLRVGQVVHVPPSNRARQVAASRTVTKRQRRVKVRSYAASKPGTRKIVHRVKRGDTLWDIAQSYGINHNDIRRWNGRRSSRLSLGQKLVLYVPQAKVEAKLQPRGNTVVHVVKRGDTLWDIAQSYGVDHNDIRRWNGRRSSRLQLGQKLVLYLPHDNKEAKQNNDVRTIVYEVRRGDNLWDISRRFKTTPAKIRRWNKMRNNRITPGDRLTVRLADNS
jgi:membrane-bound lytic murein transglycosylase D